MKEIIESYFRTRSLVNHQLASYNDCIPTADSQNSRFEKIVRNIRIGTDEIIEDDEGGIIKLDVLDHEIQVRMKNMTLGPPTIREANGAEHPSLPLECRLRKLTYMSPVSMDFTIKRNGVPSPTEKGVQVGSMPIMVRSKRCNLHPTHIAGDRVLNPHWSRRASARDFKTEGNVIDSPMITMTRTTRTSTNVNALRFILQFISDIPANGSGRVRT